MIKRTWDIRKRTAGRGASLVASCLVEGLNRFIPGQRLPEVQRRGTKTANDGRKGFQREAPEVALLKLTSDAPREQLKKLGWDTKNFGGKEATGKGEWGPRETQSARVLSRAMPRRRR